jgi:flagellar assembly protein FliH
MMSLQSEIDEMDELLSDKYTTSQSKEVFPLEFRLAGHINAPIESSPDKVEETIESAEIERLKHEIEALNARIQMCRDDHSRELTAERTRYDDELSQQIAREKKNIVEALEQWDSERRRYYASAESEVVKLSLAIAAQILNREVQMNPLALRGVVKAALEEIRDAGTVTLRIPERDVNGWKEILRDGDRPRLQIIGDSNMQTGQCVIESSVGVADLGIDAQIVEIERGFVDLLKKRPA